MLYFSMDITHLAIFPYLLMALGLILAFAAAFIRTSTNKLSATGVRCEGVVFKLEERANWNPIGSVSSNLRRYRITIRFVTEEKQEWITGEWDPEFMVEWGNRPFLKEGQRVPVLYNPENPAEFVVEQQNAGKNRKMLLVFVGILFFGIGLFLLVRET
jgi:Protein of unknown function (DUF3592)